MSKMPLFHSRNKMSPALLFIVLAIAIIVFISGLVLLLIKLLKKQSLSSILLQSNRHLDLSSSNVFQRQLHQLFHVHDSGLDQSFIDVLPMFIYKDIVGNLTGPFDCPVCLSEFLHEDKLRLLPLCKHAFHLNCIDTWLLSNSTCPLCRGTLFSPGFSPFDLDDSRNAEGFLVNNNNIVSSSNDQKPVDDDDESIVTEKRVFSLRLGKFRHVNGRDEDIELGETSNINLDSRRCFSMGSVQYVVADTEFQVALCPNRADDLNLSSIQKETDECNQNASNEGKKISHCSKRESFSISKVWLWPKKSKIPIERDNQFSMPSLPTTSTTRQPSESMSTTEEPSVTIQSTSTTEEPSVTIHSTARESSVTIPSTTEEPSVIVIDAVSLAKQVVSNQLNSSVNDENLDPRCNYTSDEKLNLV